MSTHEAALILRKMVADLCVTRRLNRLHRQEIRALIVAIRHCETSCIMCN